MRVYFSSFSGSDNKLCGRVLFAHDMGKLSSARASLAPPIPRVEAELLDDPLDFAASGAKRPKLDVNKQ